MGRRQTVNEAVDSRKLPWSPEIQCSYLYVGSVKIEAGSGIAAGARVSALHAVGFSLKSILEAQR